MKNWLEELPKKCPPNNAKPQTGTYYRLIDNEEPQISDFLSNRKIFPDKVFPNIDECTVRSCSIYNDYKQCKKQKKFSRLKHKKILKISINKNMGVLSKTFGPYHYSWWVLNNVMNHINQIEVIHD